jgi:hypothetical protein
VDFTIHNPAGYLTKYITKAVGQKEFRRYEHRYGNDRSTDWSAVTDWTPEYPDAWTFEYCPLPMMAQNAGGNLNSHSRTCPTDPGLPGPPG